MKTVIISTIVSLLVAYYGINNMMETSTSPIAKNGTYHSRLSEIADEVNSKNTTWTATSYAKWEGKTQDEVRTFLGSKNTAGNVLPEKVQTNSFAISELPTNFDSREAWPLCESIKEVRDQSKCGSCWAVSSAGAMSDRVCIGSGQKDQRRISASDILSCCTSCGDGCDGGEEDIAFKFWKEQGVVTGDAFAANDANKWCRPYDFAPCAHHVKIPGLEDCSVGELYKTPECRATCVADYGKDYKSDKIYAKSAYTVHGAEAIAREIYENGPVVTGFNVFEDFMTYKSGIYQHVTGASLDGHAVRIIGFGEENGTKYWLVANSWNEHWGEAGHFRFIRGTNDCDFEKDVAAGIADVAPHAESA